MIPEVGVFGKDGSETGFFPPSGIWLGERIITLSVWHHCEERDHQYGKPDRSERPLGTERLARGVLRDYLPVECRPDVQVGGLVVGCSVGDGRG